MKIFSLIDIENDKIAKKEIKKAFDKTVVIPTETVYGLSGRIDNDDILRDIYKIKGRPSNNPLIVHISNIDMLNDIIEGEIPEKYKKLMHKFWPGPLSLIFKASDKLSSVVKGNSLDTVAVRMPKSKTLCKIIDIVGVPLAAPSANTSGQPSPTELSHVINDLGNKVETYIDGGKCQFGLESTVFRIFDGKNYILRPGSITKEEIEEVLNEPVYIKNKEDGSIVVCPGTKYTHYSPRVDVYLFKGNDWRINMQNIIKTNKDKRIGLMINSNENISGIKCDEIYLLGKELAECASNTFSGLRDLENKVDLILVKEFEYKKEGVAIMDRIEKASSKIFK